VRESGRRECSSCCSIRTARVGARARTPGETNGERIASLYDALAQFTPSPIVELNRAVAFAMAFGAAADLELVDALTSEPSLNAYHLLPSVRGDLLVTLGRLDEAYGVRARDNPHAQRP